MANRRTNKEMMIFIFYTCEIKPDILIEIRSSLKILLYPESFHLCCSGVQLCKGEALVGLAFRLVTIKYD